MVARATANNDAMIPRVAHLEREMGEVRASLSSISDTLHGIVRTQAEIRASAPGSWQDQLQSVNNMAWLFALVVGGIIWISGQVNSKPTGELIARINILEYQVTQVRERLRRAPNDRPKVLYQYNPGDHLRIYTRN